MLHWGRGEVLSTTYLVCKLCVGPQEDTCGRGDGDKERGASAWRIRSVCASSCTHWLNEAAAWAPFWACWSTVHPKSTTRLRAETWSRRKGESVCALPGDIPGGTAAPRPCSLLSRRLVVAEIASPALQPVSQQPVSPRRVPRPEERRPQARATDGCEQEGGQGRESHGHWSPRETRLTPSAPTPN